MNTNDVADELMELMKAKTHSGGYIIPKKYRVTIIKAELLLRKYHDRESKRIKCLSGSIGDHLW